MLSGFVTHPGGGPFGDPGGVVSVGRHLTRDLSAALRRPNKTTLVAL